MQRYHTHASSVACRVRLILLLSLHPRDIKVIGHQFTDRKYLSSDTKSTFLALFYFLLLWDTISIMRNFLSLLVILGLTSCNFNKEEGPIIIVDAERFIEIQREYKGALLLDVRTPEEYSAGRLPGAVNLNFQEDEFLHKLHQLSTRQVYIIYCDDGKRSREVSEIMEQLYFKQVYVLKSGVKQTNFKLIQ